MTAHFFCVGHCVYLGLTRAIPKAFHGVAPNRGAVRCDADFSFGESYHAVGCGADFRFRESYGAVRCGVVNDKTLRCNAVR